MLLKIYNSSESKQIERSGDNPESYKKCDRYYIRLAKSFH